MPDPFDEFPPTGTARQLVTGPHADPLGIEFVRSADGAQVLEVRILKASGLRATDLVRFPWTTLFAADEHAHAASELGEAHFGSNRGPNVAASRKAVEQLHAEVERSTRRPGRAGHPDSFYKQIAQQYSAHIAAQERHPVQAITDELNGRGEFVSRNTVANWVKRARQLGYLPPAKRGTAG